MVDAPPPPPPRSRARQRNADERRPLHRLGLAVRAVQGLRAELAKRQIGQATALDASGTQKVLLDAIPTFGLDELLRQWAGGQQLGSDDAEKLTPLFPSCLEMANKLG